MRNRTLNIAAFAVLSLLWLAFAAALLFNRDLLLAAWETLRGWPLVVQLVAWLLALPVTLGLWIWHTPWPVVLRLVLVTGLAWVSVYAFFPRKTSIQPGTSPA